MAESGSSSAGFGNTRYPYYYGPEGRLVLVDSALEAVNRGSSPSIQSQLLSVLQSCFNRKVLEQYRLGKRIFAVF